MRGRSLSRIVSQARAHSDCGAGAADDNATFSDTTIVVFRNLSVSRSLWRRDCCSMARRIQRHTTRTGPINRRMRFTVTRYQRINGSWSCRHAVCAAVDSKQSVKLSQVEVCPNPAWS